MMGNSDLAPAQLSGFVRDATATMTRSGRGQHVQGGEARDQAEGSGGDHVVQHDQASAAETIQERPRER